MKQECNTIRKDKKGVCYGCGTKRYPVRTAFGNIMYYTGLVLGIVIIAVMFLAYLSQEILIWKVK